MWSLSLRRVDDFVDRGEWSGDLDRGGIVRDFPAAAVKEI